MSSNNKGRVFWVTGLAGSGKSTWSQEILKFLRSSNHQVVYLDGDELRRTIADDLGYSLEDRLKAANRYGKLCGLLSEQGIDVICATISMFHQVQAWNRNNLENYFEIFIDTPTEILLKRNQKGLYTQGQQTVGKDISPEFPLKPDFVLVNDETRPYEDLRQELIAFVSAQ